jgi:hypothetical protein
MPVRGRGRAQPRSGSKRALPVYPATADNVVRACDSFSRAVVVFVSGKSKNKTKVGSISVLEEAQRLALFGPPLLLEGEDGGAYNDFLIRIRAAVKPVDIIDDMFIADVVSLEWEVLRWRRLKLSLIRTGGLKALEDFLATKLEYDLYSEQFAADLTKILQDHLPEDQADSAQTLACRCAQDEANAIDKVNEILSKIRQNMGLEGYGLDMKRILDRARAHKAEELVREYVRGESDAITLVHELLSGAGVSMDALVAQGLGQKLDRIERIDRLATIAESRRNASLREIDRRRAVLGQTLRQRVQEIEDAEFKVIETTPANRENAA